FERIIVESHPRLIGRRTTEFHNLLRRVNGAPVSPSDRGRGVRGEGVTSDYAKGRLEVAMGLETVHPDVLPRLNKRMTLDDFAAATRALTAQGIGVRAFILVRPPFLSDREGLEWAKRSLDFAFSLGVACCSLIPTRAGNGAMERLAELGLFAPPSLESL